MNNIQMINIDLLHPHPDNPRKELGDLTELAQSIRENGVYQNLTVVPDETGYTIIIGHRRCAAAKLAGMQEMPCAVVEMTQHEQLSTMLLENMQRSDLTPYEQAQGFQLMIDMGSTVEQIVQKTGFSATTVHRRLKMAELDQKVLKEVSVRQISLEDFDKLAKIEDIKTRNDCLKNIGTSNFAMDVQKKIKKQNIGKNLPWVQSEIRRLKGKKITYSQTYYGDYKQVGSDIQIDELKGHTLEAPDTGDKKLHYFLDEDSGRLRFFVEKEKAAPVRRPQAEIDREKAMAEANEKLLEISKLCEKLRGDFVQTLTVTNKNREDMLVGVATAVISLGFKYGNVSSHKLCAVAGIERKWQSGEDREVANLLMEDSARTIPGIIYTAFCDENERYHTDYKKQWPQHKQNMRLDMLYTWLVSVGYVMSDEEIALQDGSHGLLHLGEYHEEK